QGRYLPFEQGHEVLCHRTGLFDLAAKEMELAGIEDGEAASLRMRVLPDQSLRCAGRLERAVRKAEKPERPGEIGGGRDRGIAGPREDGHARREAGAGVGEARFQML